MGLLTPGLIQLRHVGGLDGLINPWAYTTLSGGLDGLINRGAYIRTSLHAELKTVLK